MRIQTTSVKRDENGVDLVPLPHNAAPGPRQQNSEHVNFFISYVEQLVFVIFLADSITAMLCWLVFFGRPSHHSYVYSF